MQTEIYTLADASKLLQRAPLATDPGSIEVDVDATRNFHRFPRESAERREVCY